MKNGDVADMPWSGKSLRFVDQQLIEHFEEMNDIFGWKKSNKNIPCKI